MAAVRVIAGEAVGQGHAVPARGRGVGRHQRRGVVDKARVPGEVGCVPGERHLGDVLPGAGGAVGNLDLRAARRGGLHCGGMQAAKPGSHAQPAARHVALLGAPTSAPALPWPPHPTQNALKQSSTLQVPAPSGGLGAAGGLAVSLPVQAETPASSRGVGSPQKNSSQRPSGIAVMCGL